MARRYDVCSPRTRKDGKTWWVKIGAAFDGDKGIGIEFDALPLPDAEGRVSVRLFEPRAKEGGGSAPATSSGSRADIGDEIPFSPEFR